MLVSSAFCVRTPLPTCKSIQVTAMIATAGVDRRQLDHRLDIMSQDRPRGTHPTELDSAHLETRDQKEGALMVPGLGAWGYRTITRVGLDHGGRAKGPFQLGVGLPHFRATSPTHSLSKLALGSPSCWKGAAGLWRKGPMGSDYSCF